MSPSSPLSSPCWDGILWPWASSVCSRNICRTDTPQSLKEKCTLITTPTAFCCTFTLVPFSLVFVLRWGFVSMSLMSVSIRLMGNWKTTIVLQNKNMPTHVFCLFLFCASNAYFCPRRFNIITSTTPHLRMYLYAGVPPLSLRVLMRFHGHESWVHVQKTFAKLKHQKREWNNTNIPEVRFILSSGEKERINKQAKPRRSSFQPDFSFGASHFCCELPFLSSSSTLGHISTLAGTTTTTVLRFLLSDTIQTTRGSF